MWCDEWAKTCQFLEAGKEVNTFCGDEQADVNNTLVLYNFQLFAASHDNGKAAIFSYDDPYIYHCYYPFAFIFPFSSQSIKVFELHVLLHTRYNYKSYLVYDFSYEYRTYFQFFRNVPKLILLILLNKNRQAIGDGVNKCRWLWCSYNLCYFDQLLSLI